LSLVLVSIAGNVDDKKQKAKTTNNTQSVISGKIIDEKTGEALAGVKVSLLESNQTVYTDFEGNFSFDAVENGKYTVETDYISYKQSVHQNINTEILNNLNIKLLGQN
jgi:hypothetical protein